MNIPRLRVLGTRSSTKDESEWRRSCDAQMTQAVTPNQGSHAYVCVCVVRLRRRSMI
ncbi:hypothetical protein PT974_05428 [Cladobotryum mycophilum]|uniref:Uncharacterized protein n=1 Tax=Cladobotryum mycophilum TaxID=491253 RepID=A0ABR0SIR4_9HYPO